MSSEWNSEATEKEYKENVLLSINLATSNAQNNDFSDTDSDSEKNIDNKVYSNIRYALEKVYKSESLHWLKDTYYIFIFKSLFILFTWALSDARISMNLLNHILKLLKRAQTNKWRYSIKLWNIYLQKWKRSINNKPR